HGSTAQKPRDRLARRSTARSRQVHLRRFRIPSPTPQERDTAQLGGRTKVATSGCSVATAGNWRGNPQDTLNAPMNDLWVCVMSFGDYCQWQLQGAYDPTVISPTPPTTVGAQIIANAQHEGQGGSYLLPGNGTVGIPTARLGAATWTDTTGNQTVPL